MGVEVRVVAPFREQVTTRGDFGMAVFSRHRANAIGALAVDLTVIDQNSRDPSQPFGVAKGHAQKEVPVLQPPTIFVPAVDLQGDIAPVE